MHPAGSIIAFTVASGAGLGLLFVAALLALADLLPRQPGLLAAIFALALALVAGGLASSFLHLGRPERAWRAMSQWRSSWLSREAVAVAACLLAGGALGTALASGASAAWWRPAALASALLAAGTVWATAMIYASLKPVRQWHNAYVPPLYLLHAALGGTLLLQALLALAGAASAMLAAAAAGLAAACWMLKRLYWRQIDAGRSASDAASATGLGGFGRVRMLDPPHTEENFLMQEMGYRVARRHAVRLRRLAEFAAYALPGLLAVAMLLAGWQLQAVLACLAVPTAALGLLVERWLFFAEATHTVMLYYGREMV